MDNLFLEKLLLTIKKYNLISYGDKIIIAFSGGADSTALLYSLNFLRAKFNLTLFSFHIHHGIRKATADRDAHFSEQLSKEFNIPFFIEYADIPRIAAENKVSLETAGHEIRYKILRKKAAELYADKVATAHHSGDQTETILMRLIRGMGSVGFKGIAPIRENLFIRPLLQISKSEINTLLHNLNIPYIQDETNFIPCCTRNKIRNTVIPVIEKINPSFSEKLLDLSSIMIEENSLLDEMTEKASIEIMLTRNENSFSFNLNKFLMTHKALQRRILHKHLLLLPPEKSEVSFKTVEALLFHITDKTSFKSIKAGSFFLEKNTDFFTLSQEGLLPAERKIEKEYTIAQEGIWHLEEFDLRLKITTADLPENLSHGHFVVFIDKNKVNFPLTVRSKQSGDRFYPLGLSGSKKIKDYFIDMKIPVVNRDNIPILTDNCGDIIWIIGLRLDKRFRIKPNTRQCLKIEAFINGKDSNNDEQC